jgi:hypothetical protein
LLARSQRRTHAGRGHGPASRGHRAPGAASMRGRVSSACGAYDVRSPAHDGLVASSALLAVGGRSLRASSWVDPCNAAMLPQHYDQWPAAPPCGTDGLSAVSLHCRLLPSFHTPPISHSVACLFSCSTTMHSYEHNATT